MTLCIIHWGSNIWTFPNQPHSWPFVAFKAAHWICHVMKRDAPGAPRGISCKQDSYSCPGIHWHKWIHSLSSQGMASQDHMSHISPRDKGRLRENGLNQFKSLHPFLVFLFLHSCLSTSQTLPGRAAHTWLMIVCFITPQCMTVCSWAWQYIMLLYHEADGRELYMTFHAALSYNFCGNASPQMHYSPSTSSDMPVQLYSGPFGMKYVWV